ncbi:hypothetical protein LguiB_030025 [Lonicera macranthoides]
MAQEEHTPSQRCSNSSGGSGCAGGSGAVPQRGLGVAQLEKIRLEEQQKKDAAAAIQIQAATTVLSPNSIISSTNSSSSCSSSSSLAVQCPNFRPTHLSSPPPPPMPLPPQSTTDLPFPNPIFRPPPPPPSIPKIDVLRPNLVPPVSKPMSMACFEPISWQAVSVSRQENWGKLWSGEYNNNIEGENQGLDRRGFGFRSNMSLPYESNTTAPIWPLTHVVQRSQQFQQPFSSSMVNVSSGTSSSSVIQNFQMEPPSNQSYCGNNYITKWPEEEKMVGMKRPSPFSVENAPGPSFHCKFRPTYVSPMPRSDESASFSYGSAAVNIEPPNPVFRDRPSSSGGISEPNPNKIITENGALTGDFLTLAPPTTAQPHSSSRPKHPSSYISPHSQELPDFESLPYQGSGEDPIHWPGSGGSIQLQQPFFSFIPSAQTRNEQYASTISSSSNGEIEETVDLNLKL